ncbi:MAG: hypothetical protein PHE24_04580 [Patescibacteria group bacterium]|nr:hypothetical protein [Patescibacteria group bacterium]
MNKLLSFVLLAAIGVFYNSCSCGKGPTASVAEPTGAISAKIFIGPVGFLAKTQAGTAINLTKAYLEIMSGADTLKDSFDLTGSAQQSKEKIFGDIHVKTWKAKAWTIDQNKKIIHADSTTFAVVENDTVGVNLNLSANYSMFVAKIFPISDSATSVEVYVNGVLVADSVFGKNASFDTLRSYFDYLPASPTPGTSATIKINVRGDWVDADTLLWTGQKVINVISGVDLNESINLAWVGPQVGGVDITVIIGKVATVIVDGVVQPRPNTTP